MLIVNGIRNNNIAQIGTLQISSRFFNNEDITIKRRTVILSFTTDKFFPRKTGKYQIKKYHYRNMTIVCTVKYLKNNRTQIEKHNSGIERLMIQ